MTLTPESYLRVVINPGWDFNWDSALLFLPAGALALGAGLGYNPALAVALGAGGNVGEAAKDALLDTAHLSAAIAAGASGGLATRLGAGALA